MVEESLRRARPGLGREKVLRAAERLVDEGGWKSLTMSGLADALGVRAPSLYHHVESLDSLRVEIQTRTLHALSAAMRDASAAADGLDALRAQCRAHRAFALAFPQRYQGLLRASLDTATLIDAEASLVDSIRESLGSLGVPEDLVGLLHHVVSVSCFGFIILESNGFYPQEVDTDAVFHRIVEGALNVIDAAVERAPAEQQGGAGQ